MASKNNTKTTKVEKSHRNSVQPTKESILGNVSEVKFYYKIGNIVYLTAFPKKHADCFFYCKGIIKETIIKNDRPVYRVQICEVANKPIFCSSPPDPKHLLGKVVTKREHELTKNLSPLMTPKKWVK